MNWDKVIDVIQAGMIFLLILFVAVCILVLIGFDGVVGAGSMMYLTNQNLKASVGISLATSGLLMALMFLGYSTKSKSNSNFAKTAGKVIIISAGLIYLMDIYFDSLTADYLRYSKFIVLDNLPNNEKIIQALFRALMGGLSTVGEGLAVAIILGMPVLKNIISDALPKNFKSGNQNKGQQAPKPQYKPTYQPQNRSKALDEILSKLPRA